MRGLKVRRHSFVARVKQRSLPRRRMSFSSKQGVRRFVSPCVSRSWRVVTESACSGFSTPRKWATDVVPDALTTVELELKYAGYFERERVQADKLRRMSQLVLPADLPYAEFLSLSTEARQKLSTRRPTTLAQAAGIPGVSPSDLQNLLIELERRRRVLESPVLS